MAPALLPALLALGLVAGGTLLLIQVSREKAKIVRARVAMVAPAGPGPDFASAKVSRADTALLRVSVRGLRDSDLAEIERICQVVRINPLQAQFAFASARLLSGALLAVVALIAFRSLHFTSSAAGLGGVALGPIAVAVGWLLPLYLVRRAARTRAQSVSSGLPEALELLVVCVEAGLALEDALDRITVEIHATQPALAEELEMTSADLKILPDRDEAFRKLGQRVDLPSIRSVVTTLSQTLRYGTPLSGALRVAAAELRNDALLALEERANRLPTLMTLPLMLFIMPTIFLIVGGPVVLRLIDVFAARS